MATQIRLAVERGIHQGKEWVFTTPARLVVGRSVDCDVCLSLPIASADVSRHHCLIEIDPPSLRVRDLGSRNGTFVNGHLIAGHRDSDRPVDETVANSAAPHELHDGDEVRVGCTHFRVGVRSATLPLADRLLAALGR
jgi:pSer/pThr/pTyr-binding forkhead associated (FHA) protein